jgi:hypothetical protein
MLPDKADGQSQASLGVQASPQAGVPTRSQAPEDEALEDPAQALIDKPAASVPPIMRIQPLSGLSAPASLVRPRDSDSTDNTRQGTRIKTHHPCLVCNKSYKISYQTHWRKEHLMSLLHVKALQPNQILVCGYCMCNDLDLGQGITFQTPDDLALHVWKEHKQHPLPIWFFNNVLRNLISGVPVFRQQFLDIMRISENPVSSWPEDHISDVKWGLVAELSSLGGKTKTGYLDLADQVKVCGLLWRTQYPTMIMPATITNHGYLGAISPAQPQFYHTQVPNGRHSYTPTPSVAWSGAQRNTNAPYIQPDASEPYPQEMWSQYDTNLPPLPTSQGPVGPNATPDLYDSSQPSIDHNTTPNPSVPHCEREVYNQYHS